MQISELLSFKPRLATGTAFNQSKLQSCLFNRKYNLISPKKIANFIERYALKCCYNLIYSVSEFQSQLLSDESRIMLQVEVFKFCVFVNLLHNLIYLSNLLLADEDEGLEDVARCMVPIIEKHSKSIDVDSDAYQTVLKILQKESGPRFSVMKEDMNSMKEGGKGKSYSYKTHVEKHIRKLFCNLCLGL